MSALPSVLPWSFKERNMFRQPKKTVFDSPVLVVDALGVSNKIKTRDEAGLVDLADQLDANYLRFQQTLPHRVVVTWGRHVWGTKEFNCFRLNDMFVVHDKHADADSSLRYLIAASLCFQSLLLDGFIPRGGLGRGLVHARNDSFIGRGFIDAHDAAEKRSPATKDICAIMLSPNFLATVPDNAHCHRLLCSYRSELFVNPRFLHDPQLGRFDNARIIELLLAAGVDDRKLWATQAFLEDCEDYDTTLAPG